MQTELKHIPLSRIRHNPVALRSVNKEAEKYIGLVDSVRLRGVLSPISVREIQNPDPADQEPLYGVVDGLHRYSASQDAGLDSIPCQVTTLDDAEVLEAQIIANAHVIETKPVEYGHQLQRMIASNPALVAAEVASRLGKSTGWLDSMLGLDRLKEEIQALVDDGKIKLTNAYALSRLPEDLQTNFVDRAMTQSPAEFVPAAQKAKKEWDAAKRAGKDPNADTFLHIEKCQKMVDIKGEIARPAIGPALIAKYSISSPAEAFTLALKWVLNSDTDSIAAQRATHDARLADAKKKRDAAKAERDAIKAAAAAQPQTTVELAPGVKMAV